MSERDARVDVLIEHYYDHNKRVCICHRDAPGHARVTVTEREHAQHVLDQIDIAEALAWGVALPLPDGFVNPSQVVYAGTREGAEHKATVYGDGWVVVCRPVPDEWTPADLRRVLDDNGGGAS